MYLINCNMYLDNIISFVLQANANSAAFFSEVDDVFKNN